MFMLGIQTVGAALRRDLSYLVHSRRKAAPTIFRFIRNGRLGDAALPLFR